MPERGQFGTAARRPAMLRLDDGLGEYVVKLVDEQPSASIGHAHRATGCGNRSVITDGFQQPDLAVTDLLSGREVQP